VNLTTVLAHASGEWIASDWPVCRLADTATPHRMGAALTYARRYALFALVGIAGEDDLDAPDLNCRPQSRELVGAASVEASGPDKRRQPWGSGKGLGRTTLDPDASTALRDQLVREVANLGSAAAAAQWARTALPAKNTLTASDARLLEVAFEFASRPLRSKGTRRMRVQRRQRRPSERTLPRHCRVGNRLSQHPAAATADVLRRAKGSRLASTRACCRLGSRAGIGTRPTSNS
jgi:hypothetical protein